MVPFNLYTDKLRGNGEIRVLVLQRGLPNETVQCLLKTVNLDDRPKYTALSYVWGNLNEQRPILVNGVTFQATVNLSEGLHNFRKADAEEIVWADAVSVIAIVVLLGNSC
jgi:hypothetical protein